MLAFGASRRACRPTAVCIRQQTGKHTKPASREARRRAAVTPQPSRMSPYAPVRLRRAVRKGLSPRAAVTPQSICFPSSTPAPYGRGEGCRGSPPAASRRACCSTAVCTSQQTGNYTRQASREARRRAAVKPRPTSFPSGALRAYGAQSEWGSAPSPACGGGGRRRRPGESEGEGQREGRHPWSGCRPSERAGRRWRP